MNDKRTKYDMRGTKFGGGFSETVFGDQIGNLIDKSDQAAKPSLSADITNANIVELKPHQGNEPISKNAKSHVSRIFAVGLAIATIASGMATFSDGLNKFTDDLLDLSRKIRLLEINLEDQRRS